MNGSNKGLLGLFVLGSLALVVVGTVYTTKTQSPVLEQSEMAVMGVMDEMLHDWGDININGGTIEKSFQIVNNGKGVLELTNVKTSCMCTNAKITIDGKSSPSFGMHSRSGWKGKVLPGQTADVVVAFDPMFHGPQGTGPITRMVSFNTNDSNNPNVEFTLTGNVVSE